MKQVRTVKEEGEQKLHDVVFAKTKQWEKIKAEFEAKLLEFEQELIRAGAENDALTRSLQERAELLMKIDEEKGQAEAEIEILKSTIQSGEREINSLKYELHVVSKELEIRNEEKNMSVRSADVATKQHQEDVKKISKLEAECQRLRGLVRKKLPGPAALAQMKMEVESLGREYGDHRVRRSPAKNSSFHRPMSPVPDYAMENIHHMQRDNEFLTARLLTMEEETKMLKEALAKRNSELQSSRSMYAKTTGKLRSLEVQMLTGNKHKSPSTPNMDIHFDGAFSQNGSNPPSMTSMSEDGVDDEGSCTESWTNALVSEPCQFKKEKAAKSSTTESSNRLELMDDFLEMERLACLSSEVNGNGSTVDKMKVDNVGATFAGFTERDGVKDLQSASPMSETPSNKQCLSEKSPLLNFQSRISSLLDSESPENNAGKVLDSIRNILKDIEDEADSVNVNGTHPSDGTLSSESKFAMDQDLKNAILKILDFVKLLDQEISKFQGQSPDYDGLCEKTQQFSALVDKVLSNVDVLNDIVIALSVILSETSQIKFTLLRDNSNEAESNNLDCVDKVTLLENKVQLEPVKDNVPGICPLLPHSSSDPEFEGPADARFDVKTAVKVYSPEEYEQLKSEKANLEGELAKCNKIIEETMARLSDMEKKLEDLTSKLADSEKSNSLNETQLKCMAESYKSLESRKIELENEIEALRSRIDALTAELFDERQSHQEDLVKYRDLEEKMERYEMERSSILVDEDPDNKSKQEREIAAAAEKLAECQETILILGRQLQAMRPPAESLGSSPNRQRMEEFLKDAAGTTAGEYFQKPSGQPDTDQDMLGTGNVSPISGYKTHMIPSDADVSPFPSPNTSKRPKHRSRSSSSSSFTNHQLPDKQNRGFSRFFAKSKE
ncbi:Filament-like plant protein 4 [Zea mays]|nr:Filament-like plant protein 4 [Zea mays]ONL95925.1 Filament-like plant protein 4 [Zea mays]ONL95933.1 Filament-like plant protein 4 [Zea mays]ONL95940.1 Filament-like plant protein 4 [Zea mays]ONL95948.1 Filament-like plant protein 4 [Zea mays]